MVNVTDEDIAKLENAFGVKLFDHQKEMIKQLVGAGHIFIPRHHGYSYNLQAYCLREFDSVQQGEKHTTNLKEEPNDT